MFEEEIKEVKEQIKKWDEWMTIFKEHNNEDGIKICMENKKTDEKWLNFFLLYNKYHHYNLES